MARVVLSLLCCAWLCSGCFVFDELDRGEEILDTNSARGAAVAEPEEKKHDSSSIDLAKAGSEALGAVGAWWDDLRRPAPDPNDGIVRCRVNGDVQFTRESDCRSSGGRLVSP